MKKQNLLLFLLCSTISLTTFGIEVPQQSYWQRFKNWLKDSEENLSWENLANQDELWLKKADSIHNEVKLNPNLYKNFLFSWSSYKNYYPKDIIKQLNQLTKNDKQFIKLALSNIELNKSLSFNERNEQINKKEKNLYTTLPELKKFYQIYQKLNSLKDQKISLMESERTISNQNMIKSIDQQWENLEQQLENLPLLSIIKKLLQKRDSYLSQRKIDPIKIKAISSIIVELLGTVYWL